MATPKNKLTTQQKDLCRIITPEFRSSFPHLFVANAAKQGDKKKFSVTMLFPKDSDLMGQGPPIANPDGSFHPGPARSLKDVIRQAKINEFGPKENWPESLESPVNDGDDPKYKDKEGYKGHWVIKASTNEDSRPDVVDERGLAISNESLFYPGCYARAYVFAYVWEYMNKQGVGFILDHVQKTRNGKSFGGKRPVGQVFAPIAGAPASSPDADEDHDFS